MDELWIGDKKIEGNTDMREAAKKFFGGLYTEECVG